MNRDAARNRDILACLGDSSRFRLALALLEGERCVTELALAVGLSQSCTTRHLQYLEREGLVRGVRQGKRVVFRLRSDQARVRELLAWATSASPETLAQRLSGGDIHADGGGAAPRADRPRRRADRVVATAPQPHPLGSAAADGPRETNGGKTAASFDPAPDGQSLCSAGASPADTDSSDAEPNARSAEMEDWLL